MFDRTKIWWYSNSDDSDMDKLDKICGGIWILAGFSLLAIIVYYGWNS
jgi:hypothetical protein